MKGRGGKRPVNARERQGKKMFLMILPFLILCFLFSYFPLHGWIYAFYDYKAPLKLSQCPFVGFKWFRMFFSNETQMAQLWQVMKNTFAMSFLSIVTSILPLGFAIFLSEIKCKWFKSLVQTMTTLPNFISWVLVYSVAFSLFSNTGMVNTLLQNLGITSEAIKFLDSDSHTWLSMLLWHTWKNLGWSAIMYLAAISGVDQELYEAARVDGANLFQILWNVYVPLLKSAYLAFGMISVLFQWNNFLWPLVMTDSVEKRPLSLGLAMFAMSYETGAQWSDVSAATVLVCAPLLILFVVFQKQFMDSFMHSGIK